MIGPGTRNEGTVGDVRQIYLHVMVAFFLLWPAPKGRCLGPKGLIVVVLHMHLMQTWARLLTVP